MTTLAPRKDGQNVSPPPTFLAASAFHEVHAVWCGDGQTVGMTCNLLAVCHLQHLVHVYAGLGYSVRMFVHGIAQFSIVVQDKPATLPSLGAVQWIGKIPSWGYKQVPAFRNFPGCPVTLESFGTMLLFLSKAVGALAFIEDVGGELSAFGPHRCCRHVVTHFDTNCNSRIFFGQSCTSVVDNNFALYACFASLMATFKIIHSTT